MLEEPDKMTIMQLCDRLEEISKGLSQGVMGPNRIDLEGSTLVIREAIKRLKEVNDEA